MVSLAQETASDGYKTALPNTLRNIEISSRPIWDGPSSPIDTPACEPTNFMLALEYAAIRIWSCARDQNAAKVEAKGIFPLFESPIATPTIFCSAIYISKKRSGYLSLKISE